MHDPVKPARTPAFIKSGAILNNGLHGMAPGICIAMPGC
jgi:hypothetical protein